MSARIISTVGRAIDVIVAGRLVSHLRFAVGVFVLAAGLLMGGAGGAVAVADPDSSNSAAHGDGGTNASSQASPTASSPVGKVADTQRKKMHVTSTLGSGRQPGQQPSIGAKSPKKEPGGTEDSGLAAAVPDLVAAVANVVAPVPNVVAPVSDVIAPVRNLVAPVTNLVAPVSDVIAPVQDMLTSVAGAVVPLTQLQSDLSSFLLGIAGVQPVVGGVAGVHGPGLSAPAGASVASRLPLGPPLAGISGPPLAGVSGLLVTGEATGVATLDVIALGRASAVPGMAPLAPDAAFPIGVRSFLRHALHDLPVAVSVAALAAVALPGVGGLVILTLAGVRIGYRQAKAGFVLRTAGIAHFARPGPLGVVRSGSLVVVRPRGLRVVRPGALSAGCLLDKVA